MADTVRMARQDSPTHLPVEPLIVAITSRALFDLEHSHALFEREGIEAFRDHQRQREDEPLVPGMHWFRFFFCNLNGAFTCEVLRDNEPWEAGLRSLESAGWDATEGYYSVRLFLMLRPA